MRRSSQPISPRSRRGSTFERSTRFGWSRRSWPIELIVVSSGPKRRLNVICCSSVSRASGKMSTEYSWNASKIRANVAASSGDARSTPSTRAPRQGWIGVIVTWLTVFAMPSLPPPRSLPERVAQLAREDLDRPARAAGELQLPLALGLEPPVAEPLAPGLDRLADRVEVERVPPELACAGHDVGRGADERPERRARLDRVLPAGPRGRERGRERLDVVQEESLRALADLLDLAAAAELLDGVEKIHDLLGEGRLAHAPAPGAEHLDLAVERRSVVLVERADHVVREGLVRVRVELAAREADDVRRVQARVLGVDRHEQLDDLARVERVEEDGRHLDGDGLARLAERVECQETVLTVEHAQHAVLLGDLQEPEIVVTRDRSEGEPLLGGDDDGAGDRGQRPGVLALPVVHDELVDLPPNDRPLVGGLALADPLLQHVPVHPRARARAALLRRFFLRAAGVAEHLELHEPVDVLGRKAGLIELHPELLYASRRDSNHWAVTLTDMQTPVNRGIFDYTRRNVSVASAAMWRPIASEAVAPGEGALRTWMASGPVTMRKSSTSEPSGLTACARTPAPPRVRSAEVSSGTSRWSARANAARLSERYISYVPVRQ